MDALKKVRALQKEIAGLRYSIDHTQAEMVSDYYKDYRTGRGVPKSLTGFIFDDKGRCRRQRALKSKLEQIEALVDDAEKEIDQIADPEMRAILRLYYIEGKSYDEIGDILFISKATVHRRLKANYETNVTK